MAKKTKGFIFSGTFIRREGGHALVRAETAEQAKELVQHGEWLELDTQWGETDFEWDRQEPAMD